MEYCILYLFAGFGFSLCYVSTFSIVPVYFDRSKRMLCFGFITMGIGIGAVSIPLMLQFLLERYTWRGTLLIFGGFAFQMSVSAAIIAPLRSNCYSVRPSNRTRNKNIVNTRNIQSSMNNNAHASKDTMEAADNTSVLAKYFDVMRNKSFLFFALSMMMTVSAFSVVQIFLIDFYEANGIDRSTGVLLYTIMTSTSTLFRVLPGFIVQMPCIPTLAMPCFFMFVNSLALLLFPFAQEIAQYAVLAGMLGVSTGGMSWTMPSTTFLLIGQEMYSTALGLALTSLGISNVLAGPITGKEVLR